MSRSLKARIELLLSGNVTRQSRKFGRDLNEMGERGERAMTRLERRAQMAGNGMGFLVGKATALAGAYVGLQAVARELTLGERLERLGVAADVPTEKMQALRDELAATAEAEDIRIDPTQILAAIEKITEATGEFDIATSLQREIGLAIQATGSAGEEIGALVASVYSKFDIDTPEGMKQALDLLAKQGKAGAIELSNLASLGPKVFAVYGSFGKKSLEGLAEAGALMQIFKRGVGGPEQAGTVFENVFNALGDAKKLSQMQKLGIATRDAAGELKKPVELLKTIIEAAGGDDLKLGMIFDAEAMRGMRQLSVLYRETGGFADLDSLVSLKADGKTLEADAARIAAVGSSQLESSLASLREVAGEVLAEPIQQLADALKQFDKELLSDLAKGAAALAAAYVGAKVVKGGVGLASDLRAAMGPRRIGANVGGAAGPLGALAGAGPVPVFVTNPGFGGRGAGRRGGAAGAAAANATAANAPRTSANANATLRRAVVNEAAGNARGRAFGAGGAGIFTALGALSAVEEGWDNIFARTDELAAEGMSRQDAYTQAREERAQETSDAFDAWLGRTLPSIFGKAEPEARWVPVNPAKRAALAPFEARAAGETGGGIVERLIAPAPGLPQSTPVEGGDDRLLDAMRDNTEEVRAMRRSNEDLARKLSSVPRGAMSRPGNTFRSTVAP